MSDRPGEPPAPRQRPPEPIETEPSPALPVAAGAEPAASTAAEPSREPEPAPSPAEETPRTDQTLGLPPAVDPPPAVPTSEHPTAPAGTPVPFAAPPTERNGGRFALWLTLGIVGGFLLVAGVVIGFIVSAVVYANSVVDRVEAAAEDFITDLSEERWDEAHDSLCTDLREDPVEDYIDTWESWDTDDAEVLSVLNSSDGASVPVRLGDGTRIELVVQIEQSGRSIEYSVCGWRETGR